jgi:polysaccharide biosynthesis protein PslE
MAADLFSRTAMADQEPGVRITLAQVKTFLPRYKWVIAGVFLATVLSTYVGLSLTTEQYDANAALLVKLGRENLDPPPTARNGILSTGLRREELGSEVQILRSSDLFGQVVDTLGVDAFRVTRVPPPGLVAKAKFYAKAGVRWVKTRYQDALVALDLKKRLPERDAIVEQLLADLTAEPQKEADVIALHLRMANPALAVRVEQTLIQRYLVHRVQVRQASGVKEFFDGEAQHLRQELETAEARLRQWKQQHGLTVPAEQKALLLRQIRELAAQQDTATSRTQALAQQLAAARNLATSVPERVRATQTDTASPAVLQFRERLTKLQADRAKLLTTYKQGAAPVATIDEEIASLTQMIAARQSTEVGSVTTELNPIRQQLQQSVNQDTVALEGLSAEAPARIHQMAELQTELHHLESADATLVALERERAITEQNYLNAMKRLTDAEVERQLDLSRISNVSVAVPPTASFEPVYPRKLLITALSLGVGLVLGVALSIFLEWTSDAVRDARDVESATDLICLGEFGGKRRGRPAAGAA